MEFYLSLLFVVMSGQFGLRTFISPIGAPVWLSEVGVVKE